VAGFPKTPNSISGCHRDMRNSHVASFMVDTGMGLVVFGLHRLLQRRVRPKLLNPKVTTYFTFMAAIIMLHGFLHLCLSEFLNCYVAPETIPNWLLMLGRIIFGSFSFLLCFVILATSFSYDDANAWTKLILPSLLLSLIVLFLTLGSGVEWLLPALFSVSHPLSCAAALFSSSPVFTNLLGWVFLIASFMGVLELTSCETFYRNLGGHVLYDFWLHLAVLLSLPPFAPPVASLVDKEQLSQKSL
jgi:hypothetical protein